MRLRILTILLISALLVGLGGCEAFRDLITKHSINLDGAMHGKKLYKGAKNCTACHGINLNGNGPIPGCYSCHNALWESLDHSENRTGALGTDVMHRVNVFQAATTCTACHGSDYNGMGDQTQAHGGIPGCYDCHVTDEWSALSDHTSLKSGTYHGATNIWDPDDTVAYNSGTNTWNASVGTNTGTSCTDCHGTNLLGTLADGATYDYAVSCFGCHGERWQLRTHDQTRNNKKHEGDMYDPDNTYADIVNTTYGVSNTGCNNAACHGAALTGSGSGVSAVPSCYSCHTGTGSNARWVKTLHNDSEDGYLHGGNKDNPTQYCSACHLDGDGTGGSVANGTYFNGTTRAGVPTCTDCHGKEWDGT